MYQLMLGGVLRIADGSCVPEESTNRDWQQYLEWLSLGNEPLPASIEVICPSEVSMMQARLALLNAGLLNQVEASIETMTEPSRTASRIRWEFASTVRRNDPLVYELGISLELTDEQLDQLFSTAATL